MQITFKKKEILEILKAWLAISLAFTILLSPSLTKEYAPINAYLITFNASLIIVGLGFIAHELAHKITAQKFYCSAEFKSNNFMLITAILMSFIGFIIAAPGAVWIKGAINKKQKGIIALTGPLTNLGITLLFLPGIFLLEGLIQFFFFQGFFINSILGLFNMIPLKPFDGVNVYKWNKPTYIITTATLFFLVSFAFFIM